MKYLKTTTRKETHNFSYKNKKGTDIMNYNKNSDDLAVYLPLMFALFLIIWVGFNFVGLWLWGIIAVQIFGLPALTFWQFFGLRVLLAMMLPTHNFKWNKSEDR